MVSRGGALRASALLLWAACGGPLFAAAPPPTGGTIAIEASTAGGDYDPTTQIFTGAVAAAFGAKGFTMLDDADHAGYVVELLLGRAQVGTGLAHAPGRRSPQLAGSGVALPLSTGRSELVPLLRTRLELRIHRRGNTAPLWSGAAVTVRDASARNGSDASVAADLTRVLLQAYPAPVKGTIGVP